MVKYSKYIIIGAGLSGLTTAYQLLQKGESDILILEGRDRIGGRILTQNHIDFGPAWYQPTHQNLQQLLKDLDVGKFTQYSKGKSVLVYNTMANAHFFETDQTQPSAYRIAGGSYTIIKKLANLVQDRIRLNTRVTGFKVNEKHISVLTERDTFSAEKVVVTLPPKLATELKYTPQLPETLLRTMESTQTWMSNAVKVGISYKRPFWRENKFSGTIIGQIGPVMEIYDHTNANETAFSLMGFVNESLRSYSAEDRKERILSYLETYLGKTVRDYISYKEKDWSQDVFTNGTDLKSTYLSPKYGNEAFNSFYMDDKLLFSGTETSPQFGGYLEGAVISGIIAANKL